jgi:hypothetical protein
LPSKATVFRPNGSREQTDKKGRDVEPPPNTLQHWECVVDGIDDEVVYLRLLDVTAGALMADEAAEVPIGEFTSKMLEVMKPGTLLAWFIHETPEGTASTFRLHVRKWTQEDIDRANAEADALCKALNSN